MKMQLLELLLFLNFGPLFSVGQLITYSINQGQDFQRLFTHDNYYTHYGKYCCKQTQSRCTMFINTEGFIANEYWSRARIKQYSGAIELIIRNVQKRDTGVYRCGVDGFNLHVNFHLQIAAPETQTPPRTAAPASTVKTTTLVTAGLQNQSPDNRDQEYKWVIPLAATLAVLMLVLICSVAVIIRRRRKKTENKPAAPSETSVPLPSCESLPELDSITYTTVDFKPAKNNDAFDLYANLRMHESETAPASRNTDTVEYSTVAFKVQ
ncbi:uncharacterized protein [Lepisosteus oculatus]|uniref:uncharacterized protein n=1 Tax=Lepisosteus oculatus TaxID=7918 RepID=UPI0037159D6E